MLAAISREGAMNRANAYKAVVGDNQRVGREADEGVNSRPYTYPILMTFR